MNAYDEKCAGCRWESPPEHPGRCYNEIVRDLVGSASRPLQFIARANGYGPCGPNAKLFEPKEKR